MSWKSCGRKWSRPTSRFSPRIPVGSVETTKLCIFGVRTNSSRTPTDCRLEAVPLVHLVGLASSLSSCLYFHFPYIYPWPFFMISFFLLYPFFSQITSPHATDPDHNRNCQLLMHHPSQ
jgi:hypothetical protein